MAALPVWSVYLTDIIVILVFVWFFFSGLRKGIFSVGADVLTSLLAIIVSGYAASFITKMYVFWPMAWTPLNTYPYAQSIRAAINWTICFIILTAIMQKLLRPLYKKAIEYQKQRDTVQDIGRYAGGVLGLVYAVFLTNAVGLMILTMSPEVLKNGNELYERTFLSNVCSVSGDKLAASLGNKSDLDFVRNLFKDGLTLDVSEHDYQVIQKMVYGSELIPDELK
ncbi:MAG: CvpA family protein [Erysipelotrichaceae bacterium]|nr:CvpA family protein [Erysipelotrichaceae bacterium]